MSDFELSNATEIKDAGMTYGKWSVPLSELSKFAESPAGANPWVNGAPIPESIQISEWQASWSRKYEELAADLRSTVGTELLGIEHVGSTAVQGLEAKDVIDIDLVVREPGNENSYKAQIETLGYVLTIREPWLQEHRCFRLTDPQRVNLHIFGPQSSEHARHLIFRDWLREHAGDRDAYAAVKHAARVDAQNAMEYNSRKQRVVREIYGRIFQSLSIGDSR